MLLSLLFPHASGLIDDQSMVGPLFDHIINEHERLRHRVYPGQCLTEWSTGRYRLMHT